MFLDDFFDGNRTGHGGFPAQQSRPGTQGKSGDMPKRRQCCRPHSALNHHFIKSLQVFFFRRRQWQW